MLHPSHRSKRQISSLLLRANEAKVRCGAPCTSFLPVRMLHDGTRQHFYDEGKVSKSGVLFFMQKVDSATPDYFTVYCTLVQERAGQDKGVKDCTRRLTILSIRFKMNGVLRMLSTGGISKHTFRAWQTDGFRRARQQQAFCWAAWQTTARLSSHAQAQAKKRLRISGHHCGELSLYSAPLAERSQFTDDVRLDLSISSAEDTNTLVPITE